ncbi:MAG: hypothetical protein KAG53_04150 [Endozoicomonadaceae bacterium]|nr:hypothetical protein [Endozoicomonadaceae bacterium]
MPYICTICGKKFTQKDQLEIHNLIHIGKQPYICEICTFACSHSSNLRKHYKSLYRSISASRRH